MYGMTVHEMDLELRRERGSLDHLFMMVVFGDLAGLPLLPPYYSMRLLPYIIPSIETWKRTLLRERPGRFCIDGSLSLHHLYELVPSGFLGGCNR